MADAELAARAHALVDAADPNDQYAFRGAQYDAGLAWVHFPEGRGGLGLPRDRQRVVNEVLRDAGIAYRDLVVNPIGIGMAAPTLLAHGSDALQERHLRPIFTGEDVWCQLFSEPTHGSDLSGITSRAVRDGDEWVVNGQKVWTTLAHVSNFGLLVARTEVDLPKHRGLSYFVLDMHAPGVEVRPLFQLTGEAEFNEVFLTDVRVPHAALLGAEGDGWKVATTTLMNERVSLGGSGGSGRGSGPVRTLVDTWCSRQDQLAPAARRAYRARVVDLWARAEVLRLTNQRMRALALAGDAGPRGSIGKLLSAELHQRIYDLCVDLIGAEGMLHEPGYPMHRPESTASQRDLTGLFLRSRANTIEGGTSEIMRNILGERVLGLPGDVSVDRDVPWSQIARR